MIGQAPTIQRFPIRIGRRSQLVLLLFGARPANAHVNLGSDELDAHFGFFRFRTPMTNLTTWRIEGPWRWITAIGVRFSVRDHDLTFGGTDRGGVRVDFMDPLSYLDVRVPALYLTVEDIRGSPPPWPRTGWLALMRGSPRARQP